MSVMPKITKTQLNLRIEIEIDKKLRRYGEATHESRTDAAISIIERAVRDVQLTLEDYEQITKEIRANEAKRRSPKH